MDTTCSFYKDAFFFLITSFIPFVHESSLLWIFSVFFDGLYAFLLSLQKVSLISLCATCKNVAFVADSFLVPCNKLTHFYSVTLFEMVVEFFWLLLPLQGHRFQSTSKQLLTVARNLL